MKRNLLLLVIAAVLVAFVETSSAQRRNAGTAAATETVDMSVLDNYFPVRSFYVSLPAAPGADEFIEFVKNDLIPGGFNNLIVRLNFAFPFQKHPELRDRGYWEIPKIKELVAVCKEGGVTLVPMINLLGHQSWASNIGKLLEVYPQFDETPNVKLFPPETGLQWPNPDGLYCKSYCPNHPELHPILFACIDEIMDAFEADNFHAGMDEVFYLAHEDCPRCKGMDPAQVFADEVNRLSAHVRSRGARLWIWADRLLDGRNDATGYGEWSASMNNTARAIDMIDRSVVMCDWHYRVAEQSAVLFALKGYDVITCGWVHPPITQRQLEDMLRYRKHSSVQSEKRYLGFMQTVWSGFPQFIRDYRNRSFEEDNAAGNYVYLKDAFRKYAMEFKDKPLEEKDGRRIQGQ